MSAPEQQPTDPHMQGGGAAPVTADPSGSPVSDGTAEESNAAPQPQAQPQYGQYAQPDYGAMLSQFGPNYNPYLYGAPDPEPKQDEGAEQGAQAPAAGPRAIPGAAYPGGYPGPQGQPYGYGRPGEQGAANPQYGPQSPMGAAGGNGPAPDGHTPRYFYGIDVNDPNQNPLYGRWDSYAVIAFIFALVFTVPVLPAVMGGISVWRTGMFHMKGRGLAIAAIDINVLTTIVQIWMWVNGMDITDLTNQMLGMYGSDSGSGDTMTT